MLKVFAIRACAAITCLSAFAGLGAASAAAAATANPAGISIGPIHAGHGYSVTVNEAVCPPTATSGLTIDFSKGSKFSISHDYSGGSSTCTVSGSLASGVLSAHWGGLAAIHLTVKKSGTLKRLRPPRGCTGTVGTERPAVATGTLRIQIHPGVFGRVRLHRASAFIQRFGTVNCRPSGGKDVSVFGTFGQSALTATQPARGPRSVLISGSGPALAGGIKDSFVLEVQGGSSLFNAASSLDSAKIGKAGSVLRGSMSFTALPPCVGSPQARNGSFSGALVVRDPVAGNLTLAGSQAANGSIALGANIPGTCNGPGSSPATAAFTNTCSVAGICSVSSMTNTDTFYDESFPGSQGNITSETWNFGDGSPLTSGTVGFSINHTYAKAGTYTVTLTMVDGQGVTHTATGTSIIGT